MGLDRGAAGGAGGALWLVLQQELEAVNMDDMAAAQADRRAVELRQTDWAVFGREGGCDAAAAVAGGHCGSLAGPRMVHLVRYGCALELALM